MAAALDLDPGQLGREANHKGVYDSSPVTPLELHPAAMRAACDLIDRLYGNGFLDLLRALVSSSGDIAAKVAEGADTGQAIRVIRNGMTLLSLLGSVDPAVVQSITSPQRNKRTVADKKKLDEKRVQPPGLWAVLRRFSSSDGRRGLALIADAVEAIGRAARSADKTIR